MTKEDLVIEFHKKLDFVEKKFFENIDLRREAQDKLWDQFYLEYYGTLALYNPNPETISFYFNHEFYIKGHRCKIAQIFKIVVFKEYKKTAMNHHDALIDAWELGDLWLKNLK